MRETLLEDREWMRGHPKTVIFIILLILVFGWLFVQGTIETSAAYDRMTASPHTELDQPSRTLEADGDEGEVDKGREAYIRYDASQDGVVLPISREERLATKENPADQEGTEYESDDHRHTCQDPPMDTGYSDLCAQWASVAASRYGNRIGAENYRVSSFAALISALAFVATVLAVSIAAVAARDASRAVSLMKEGMLPLLTVRPAGSIESGKLRLINAGTGVATNIALKIGGDDLPLRRSVLQAGEELSVTSQSIVPADGSLNVALHYKDGSGQCRDRAEAFRVEDGSWVQIS
ncbi:MULTISPECIES: hypothetical protein [unclassified Citromicrobium]|uniref:hypothetical protein n=1 Tax=unclassified Citromicrobium TaxID=2630544 RepID=UPI0012E11FBC|nr:MULTISPECIES: hypothetical protein [unclassified Citromicrobium]